MGTQFSAAYEKVRSGLASTSYSSDKDWQAVVKRARKLAGVSGFDDGESDLGDNLRKVLKKAAAQGTDEATTLFTAAGTKVSGAGAVNMIDKDLAEKLGALKMIRHLYFLKRWGGHKEWVVALPDTFTKWPDDALRGGVPDATSKLNDTSDHFTVEQRKHLKDASQEGLKWVQRSMIVAADTKKAKNFEKVARWFADANSTDKDVAAMGATLNAGFKKIAGRMKSGSVIYTDSVSERGTTENEGTEAFVWGDALDVVYIENEFFGSQNTLTGLTNWARIIVHELTHREVKTVDVAYEHQGMAPKKIGAAKALTNADSWAWFAADCAGAVTEPQINNALAR